MEERREIAIRKIAEKNSTGPYADWFPDNEATRKMRHTHRYKEEHARCNRLRDSPIYYMRRKLNEQ